jgi:predicted glycoside hydrolase/deacetylase ChbG (UPF0249 family)
MVRKMDLIVNADDLGYSSDVNEAILTRMAQGCITSSTILANGPALDDAIRRIRDYPQYSIGVHLNLTEFRPLVGCNGLLPILDAEGCFAIGRIRHSRITGHLQEAIFQEWCAQIERLASLGLRPSHIDSHHHVHTIPALFPVLKRIQRRFGLRKVRPTMNIYPPDATKTPRKMVCKVVWNLALHYYYRTATCSGFTNLSTFYAVAQQQPLSHHSVEVSVHPGQPGFEHESRVLDQPWQHSLPFMANLIGYHDLGM